MFQQCDDISPYMRRKIEKIAARYGFRVSWKEPTQQEYQAHAGLIRSKYPSTILHELGHFIVAAPSRKHMPDFGLGPPPDGAWVERTRPYLSKKYAYLEETQVSVLGIQAEKALRLDWRSTYAMHNWDSYDGHSPDYPDVVKKLIKKGLCDQDGKPYFIRGQQA